MTSPGIGSTTQRLGRYHLAEPLGGGPTGEVFRAKVYGVAGFDRQFAVKRFHTEFVKDPDTAAAISAAARTYGSLEHPRIARLHEYGVTGGYTFTATELIQGLDLARLLGVVGSLGSPLPHGAAAALISQAARTVGYAHGRGICHLGLCPTNLIVTPEGEIKITDFGFLPARLPARPAEDSSLHARLPYLTPEQIHAESTSAATDVFQLGVIAYELMAGKQAFSGPTPQEIAQKILATPPSFPDLPKSAVFKVLQRCLARSPFERYPDARALADAIDAATRSAPLPGGVHDISTAVRAAMEHLENLGEEQGSGAVSFPLPAPPRPPSKRAPTAGEQKPARTTMRMPNLAPAVGSLTSPKEPAEALLASDSAIPVTDVDESEERTNPVRAATAPPFKQTLRGAVPELRPIKMPPLVGPAEDIEDDIPTSIRERDKGFVSVPTGPRRPTTPFGIPAVGSQPRAASSSDASSMSSPRPATARPVPEGKTPDRPAPSAGTLRSAEPASQPDQDTASPKRFNTPPDTKMGWPDEAEPDAPLETPAATAEAAPAPASPDMGAAIPSPPPVLKSVSSKAQRRKGARSGSPDRVSPEVLEAGSWDPLTPVPRDGMDVPSRDKSRRHKKPTGASQQLAAKPAIASRLQRNAWKWAVAAILLLGVGGGGYVLYNHLHAGADAVAQSSKERAASDAGAPAPTIDAGPGDASVIASASVDAASGTDVVPDKGLDDPAQDEPVVNGKLVIASKPAGARIYLDGSPMGKTPLTLDATADRHRLAVVLPGYKLYTAEIKGSGKVDVALEEIAPPEGPGGIKVRCSKKNRYYIFIDGMATGQLCPSERIGVEVGAHVVEIYDPVTDSRREFPVTVAGTRHSARIRVD